MLPEVCNAHCHALALIVICFLPTSQNSFSRRVRLSKEGAALFHPLYGGLVLRDGPFGAAHSLLSGAHGLACQDGKEV